MLIVGLGFRISDRLEPFISLLLEVHRLAEKFLASKLQEGPDVLQPRRESRSL